MSNKAKTTILAVVLVATLCGCSEPVEPKKTGEVPAVTKSAPAPAGGFTLGIEQNGQRIPIGASKRVFLDRAPFRLVFYFREHGSMLVNASFSPEIMNRAGEGADLDKLLLKDAAIAEDFGNTEKLLCIRQDGQYQNWLCLGKDKHRFDAGEGMKQIPSGYESGYLCRRTIGRIDTGNGTVDVDRCPSDVIYLIFVKMVQKDGSRERVEKKRECLEIRFRKSSLEYSSR